MRANYYAKPISKSEANRIAKREVLSMYDQVFSDCAEDVMQQTLANVLLCLERDYGFKDAINVIRCGEIEKLQEEIKRLHLEVAEKNYELQKLKANSEIKPAQEAHSLY